MLLTKCLEQCLIQNMGSVILTILFHFILIFSLIRKWTMCGKSGNTDQFPVQNPKLRLQEAAALFSSGP